MKNNDSYNDSIPDYGKCPDTTLRVAGLVNDSITDGPGLRLTLFLQGCLMNCPGCHNPDSLNPNGGTLYSVKQIIEKINNNPLLAGVTFSGGEPFLQTKQLLPLARYIKESGLDLAIYTGYTFEDLHQGNAGIYSVNKNLVSADVPLSISVDKKDVMDLLSLADTLIDGPFVLEQRSLTLSFRGSKNQRILNASKSLSEKSAVWSTDPAWIDT